MMDVVLSKKESPKIRRRIIFALVLVVIVIPSWIALYRMDSLTVSVAKSKLWIGEVEQGLFVQEVHGNGELVPEETRYVTVPTPGTVERILCWPGSPVNETTVIIELSNPDLEQETLSARMTQKSLKANLVNIQMQQNSHQLEMRSSIARLENEYKVAKIDATANENLLKDGLVEKIRVEKLRLNETELARRLEFERERLAYQKEAAVSSLNARQAEMESSEARLGLLEKRLAALKVTPRAAGVLQRMDLEIGQRVVAGTRIAEVSDATRLKAVIRIPATQVKDVAMGQSVTIDTHDGLIDGKVSRIDPSVTDGSISVTVRLVSELPKGARPDLNIEGRIELRRFDDLVHVKRPALCKEDSQQVVFKLNPETGMAEQTRVQFGKLSVNTIEVVEGLKVGDRIILSDTEQWDKYQQIKVR